MSLEDGPSAVILLVDGSEILRILRRGWNELYKMGDMFSNDVLLLKDQIDLLYCNVES